MDYQVCKRPPTNVTFFINVIIHVFILLMIISGFFFIYVSQLAKDKFRGELSDVITENLGDALRNADSEGYIKKGLQVVDLEKFKDYYDRPDPTAANENSWLFRTTIMIVIVLVLLLVIVVVIVKLFCKRIPFGSVLVENLVLFTLVGAVEICFFLFIARYFVPTKPSLIIQSTIESIKENI